MEEYQKVQSGCMPKTERRPSGDHYIYSGQPKRRLVSIPVRRYRYAICTRTQEPPGDDYNRRSYKGIVTYPYTMLGYAKGMLCMPRVCPRRIKMNFMTGEDAAFITSKLGGNSRSVGRPKGLSYLWHRTFPRSLDPGTSGEVLT